MYTESFKVRVNELGLDHKLRLQVLCNHMEHVAGMDAANLGLSIGHLEQKGCSWVLARQRILIHRLPEAGETITLSTWPLSIEKLLFRRDFLTKDADGEIIAAAVTHWTVFDLEKRKVIRVPDEYRYILEEAPARAVEDGDVRIPALRDKTPGPAFPVRLADIDQNQHVNNVRYFDFILEAADCFGTAGRDLARIDIMYKHEGLRGDIILSHTAPEEGASNILIHTLTRQSDACELARARTVWKT